MQSRFWKFTLTFLVLSLAAIVIATFQLSDPNLRIIACDVGQGDAILITWGQTQILTDGGPNDQVLDCLGKYMPFWDREIELIISTHPDSDHSTGLVSVLQYYKVDKILINPISSGAQVYQALVSEVGSSGTDVINPTEGMKLRLGLIYLDIVSPNAELFSKLSVNSEDSSLEKYLASKETNLYSIVYLLKYKNFSGLFAGDMPPEISDRLSVNPVINNLEYIKIPHHGSVNGITENLLKAIDPKIAVISVGKNSWGLPKEEILNLISQLGIKTYRTDQIGDVVLFTDGEKYWINK